MTVLDTSEEAVSPVDRGADGNATVDVRFQPRNIWRVGFVVVAVVAVALFAKFVIDDGGSVIFTVFMSWFAAIAIEPAVSRLSRRMRRGAATGLVMITIVVFAVLFVLAFGQLFVEQVANLVRGLPTVIQSLVDAVNQRTGSNYQIADILASLNIQPEQVAAYASSVLGGVLGILGSVVGSVFGLFTFGLFTFYLSAESPRLRLYVASLFPQRIQPVAANVWDITAAKTGGYVGARVVLALINASLTAVVFALIGMPSWLALAIWTGVVAQFVPTIGTYIAIVLPVLVGLISPTPWIGVVALAWGILYQQVENLTIEPRISAKAVDVQPAVAFAAVMLGTALFGVAGAFVSVPVVAMLLTLSEVYRKRYALIPELAAKESGESSAASP